VNDYVAIILDGDECSSSRAGSPFQHIPVGTHDFAVRTDTSEAGRTKLRSLTTASAKDTDATLAPIIIPGSIAAMEPTMVAPLVSYGG